MLRNGEKWGTVAHMQRPLLVGEFEFTLDAKNRIAVPARLRPAFTEGIYVTQENERCLGGAPRSSSAASRRGRGRHHGGDGGPARLKRRLAATQCSFRSSTVRGA